MKRAEASLDEICLKHKETVKQIAYLHGKINATSQGLGIQMLEASDRTLTFHSLRINVSLRSKTRVNTLCSCSSLIISGRSLSAQGSANS